MHGVPAADPADVQVHRVGGDVVGRDRLAERLAVHAGAHARGARGAAEVSEAGGVREISGARGAEGAGPGVAGEAADPVLDAQPPTARLVLGVLVRRAHVAPAGRQAGQHRRGRAALGLGGERRGERITGRCGRVRGAEHRRIVPGEVAGVGAAGQKVRLTQDRGKQADVGDDAVHLGAFQHPGQPGGRLGPGPAGPDDLGQHRVVVGAHQGAVLIAGVGPDALGRRDREPVQRAGHGPEVGGGVLGVQPGLDRVPRQLRVQYVGAQGLAAGHPQLHLDQVQTGDQFRDRVLDLQPGVYLQEVEAAGLVQDELDRARARVADRLTGGDRGGAERGPQVIAHGRGRGLLDDLLVAALDRAFPLEQVHHGAAAVPDDLHLDVPRVGDVPLGEHRTVPERGRGLPAGGSDRAGQVGQVPHQPHAPATAAERRLDQQRQAHPADQLAQVGVAGDLAAGQHRHARLFHQLLRAEFGAHRGDHVRGRPDEGQPGDGDVGGERGVLGQEPVAGVDGVRAGRFRRRDDEVTAQVRVGRRGAGQPDRLVGQPDVRCARVRVGVDGHGVQAQGVRGAHDPDGDLPPVGDQQTAHADHIRKTPKPRRPATTLEWTADRARPSTVRVSRGSTIPSS